MLIFLRYVIFSLIYIRLMLKRSFHYAPTISDQIYSILALIHCTSHKIAGFSAFYFPLWYESNFFVLFSNRVWITRIHSAHNSIICIYFWGLTFTRFVVWLKVDVEESLSIAKAESIRNIPTFKIYKNGEKVKEMVRPSHQFLEDSVRTCSL